MSQQVAPHGNRRSPRARWIVAGSLIAAVIAVTVALAWLTGGIAALGARTVDDLLASSPNIHPVEVTGEVCGEELDCVEAWRTDVGHYLRFDSPGDAEYWETVLGDAGRRWQTIVLDMRDVDLTFDQKRVAIDTLYAYRDWS